MDDDADPFVDALEILAPAGARPERRGAAFVVPCASGCRVRYAYRLRDAALAIHDGDTALAVGASVLAPPSTWLLHPREAPDGARYRFHVVSPGSAKLATGVRPATAPSTFEALCRDLPQSSYAVVGPFHRSSHVVGGATIDLAVAEDPAGLVAADLGRWVERSAGVLTSLYGRFPTDRLTVIVSRAPDGSPTRGKTLGDGGAAIWLRAGAAVNPSNVAEDWVLVHEMLHVGFPSIPREHAWLAEGLPSYVEPFLRARAGLVSTDKVWRELYEGLPQGLPAPGDASGLVGSTTIERVYWGGTAFFLEADLEIRKRTNGRRSLDDVVRAALAELGSVERHATVEEVLDVGDRATGTTVLHELYAARAVRASAPDLAALWSQLGVALRGGVITLDDAAPLGAMRRSMTEPHAKPPPR